VPFLGVKTAILRADGSEVDTNEGGSLCVVQPWPGMIRGVYGDAVNARVKSAYYHMFDGLYFSGDGARQDEDGYIWLLGRMDDVINVSGHRFATAEFESSLVGYDDVAEAAVVGYPHDIKGQGVYCYVTLKAGLEPSDELQAALVAKVRNAFGENHAPDSAQDRRWRVGAGRHQYAGGSVGGGCVGGRSVVGHWRFVTRHYSFQW